MTKARVIEVRGKDVTVAIDSRYVRDYNTHANEFLVTLSTQAAADLLVALGDTDLGVGMEP